MLQGHLLSWRAAGSCLLVFASCSDPELETDLNSQGPPEVTLVGVPSQAAAAEAATFCLSGEDIKVNRDLCPETEPGMRDVAMVTDATPLFLYTRIVFSELLNPDIEELVDPDGDGVMQGTLANTQPVALRCNDADVAYDGFYDPSGNDVTHPPGPALVIEPSVFIATSSSCTVAVSGSVEDKDGNSVEEQYRGPYEFQIATLGAIGSLPADGEEMVDPTLPIVVAFNAPLDPDTLDGNFALKEGATDVPVVVGLVPDNPMTEDVDESDPTAVVVAAMAGALNENSSYELTVAGSGITDIEGGEVAQPFTLAFMTGVVPPSN